MRCFAVKRGESKARLDPKFVLHGGYQSLHGALSFRLGALVIREPEYGSGERAIPLRSPTDVKYIRVTDFNDDGIVPGNEFVTAENIEDRYRLVDGDVLFARSGATAGKTYIYSSEIGPSIFAGYCIRFQFDINKALPTFIYFYTKTNRYLAWVRSIQRPSGQPNINKEEFKSFTVPRPPLPVQQEMVAEMEKARDSRHHKLEQADSLLSSIDAFLLEQLGLGWRREKAHAAFAVKLSQIDGPINPGRYVATAVEQSIEGTTLSQVADILDNKIAPARIGPNKEWDWIRIDDLKNSPLAVELIRTKLGSEIEGTFFNVQENDILLARLGPSILNHKIVLCPKTSRQTIASSEFLVLRCKAGWNPVTVLWVLRTSLYRDLIYSKARGATPSRYRVNREDLESLPFPQIEKEYRDSLATEITWRLNEVQHLREQATGDWDAAKAQFEAKLLGEVTT